MGEVSGIKGIRHIALNVEDLRRSKAFYRDLFGMKVVWEPDAKNVYLSSGCDNLALHEVPKETRAGSAGQQLDHFGFVVDSVERVRELEEEVRRRGGRILHPFKIHRDNSASFYCADPDGIVIQILFEPQLSLQTIK